MPLHLWCVYFMEWEWGGMRMGWELELAGMRIRFKCLLGESK